MDLAGLTAILLPDPERTRLRAASRMDLPRASFALGLVEAFAAALYLVHDYLRFVTRFVAEQTALVVERAPETFDSFEGRLAFNWSGSLAWLAFLARPITWLLLLVVAVGWARMVAYLVDRQVVGEPIVWLVLRSGQALGSALRGRARRLAFGPQRPDRVLRKRDGSELVIVSCVRRPEWNQDLTIEVDERFYRLVEVEERPDGPYRAYAYRLRERPDDAEVIRGLVRYDPPP